MGSLAAFPTDGRPPQSARPTSKAPGTVPGLAGWGNYPRLDCRVAWPESIAALPSAVDRAGTIPRGLGRSYGDPALLQGGTVLNLTGLDRFLAFDEESGALRCEAGVSLKSIIEHFGPRGFFPQVTPGTKYVTVGGCFANDVHGKAHHKDGCFSNHVDSLRLLLANGEIRNVSRESDPDLFWASAGGLGLTGVILDLTLRLRKIESTYFHKRAIVARDLSELLHAISKNDALYPYSVAWIDPVATGKHLGRGVLTVGNHARAEELPVALQRDPLRIAPPPRLNLPFTLPNISLNPVTLRVLNAVMGRVQAGGGRFAHYDPFFYPLDIVRNWNRGYGARGFTQYQFAIPLEEGERRMRGLLQMIAESARLPFLNVLKKFGTQGPGHLSFPFEGWTFAIDFPISQGLDKLLLELDAAVIDAGGRVYLGKDAFLRQESLAPMYPRLEEWKAIKRRVDPTGVFRSALSDRVGLT